MDAPLSLTLVGATGLVGTLLRDLLEPRPDLVGPVRFLGSARSAGRVLPWRGLEVEVEDVEHAEPDTRPRAVTAFSAGAGTSLRHAERFARTSLVIDNSSAWRSRPDVPLVVAEVNPHHLAHAPLGIVANPNCTTMGVMPVLAPLHHAAGVRRLTATTYQAVSGGGRQGVEELTRQVQRAAPRAGELVRDGRAVAQEHSLYADTIAFNVVPLAGDLLEDGSGESVEERKLRDESRKILGSPPRGLTPGLWRAPEDPYHDARSTGHPAFGVSATCVRVPVMTGHTTALHVDFHSPLSAVRAVELLAEAPGVVLVDLPTPLAATGTDPTLVGRVRDDLGGPFGHSLAMVTASDNLLKGAALNVVQLLELLH
jgi:aspartate-semialdehyde dehydrogenase